MRPRVNFLLVFVVALRSAAEDEKWKIYAFLPSDERVNSCIPGNWHQILLHLLNVALSWVATRRQLTVLSTLLPYEASQNWGSDSVRKLVSLLSNSQTSPEAMNSILLLKVELYYTRAEFRQSETWEMREQRNEARNSSLRIFRVFENSS